MSTSAEEVGKPNEEPIEVRIARAIADTDEELFAELYKMKLEALIFKARKMIPLREDAANLSALVKQAEKILPPAVSIEEVEKEEDMLGSLHEEEELETDDDEADIPETEPLRTQVPPTSPNRIPNRPRVPPTNELLEQIHQKVKQVHLKAQQDFKVALGERKNPNPSRDLEVLDFKEFHKRFKEYFLEKIKTNSTGIKNMIKFMDTLVDNTELSEQDKFQQTRNNMSLIAMERLPRSRSNIAFGLMKGRSQEVTDLYLTMAIPAFKCGSGADGFAEILNIIEPKTLSFNIFHNKFKDHFLKLKTNSTGIKEMIKIMDKIDPNKLDDEKFQILGEAMHKIAAARSERGLSTVSFWPMPGRSSEVTAAYDIMKKDTFGEDRNDFFRILDTIGETKNPASEESDQDLESSNRP